MLDPQKYGVEGASDLAAFLLGAFLGGTLDAILDTAAFAEPGLFAGICGAGTLGAKKLAIDTPRHARLSRLGREVKRLRYKAKDLRRVGKEDEADEVERRADRIELDI